MPAPPLGGAAGLPEMGAGIPALSCNCLLVIPELLQNATHFWSQPITLQGMQEASAVSYAFWRSRNTINKDSWYMITSSFEILSSVMAIHVPQWAQNPCNTPWNFTAILIQVSMTDYNIFHRNSSNPIPWVYVFPLGINSKIVQLSSVGRVLFSYMCCIRMTISPSRKGWGRGGCFTVWVGLL